MDRKKIILGLFAALAIVQIGVPVSMIMQQEGVLTSGQEFRFRTAPIDPFDAFRGRYVALSLEENTVPKPENVSLKGGEKVFAIIDVDPDGFAKFTAVTTKQPADVPYLKATVSHEFKNVVYLNLPIDRYYMEEKKAPAADRLYRRYSSGDRKDAYVVVVIKNGNPVIKDLYVGGKPIKEAVKEEMKK